MLALLAWLLLTHTPTRSVDAATLQAGGQWPGATVSLYMESVDLGVSTFYGSMAPHLLSRYSLIVLDYGQPWFNADTEEHGVNYFDRDATFASDDAVETSAENFIAAYINNAPSGQGPATFGIGLNNFASSDPQSDITESHGLLWSQMVVRINQWIQSQGYQGSWDATGAVDFEVDYAHVIPTRAWVTGYNEASSILPYYYIGDCAGCPLADRDVQDCPPPTGGYCDVANAGINNDWSVEDVYYLSHGRLGSGAGAFAVPQIYTDATAQEWEYIYLYGQSNPPPVGGSFLMWGILNNSVSKYQQMETILYTPREGWDAMLGAMRGPQPYTVFTHQSFDPWYSTDIAYEQSDWLNFPTCFA